MYICVYIYIYMYIYTYICIYTIVYLIIITIINYTTSKHNNVTTVTDTIISNCYCAPGSCGTRRATPCIRYR